MLTKFCGNSKIVSSDIRMTKNIVVPLSSSSLQIKFIVCFKFTTQFAIKFVLSNLLQLVYNDLKNIHNPINCQFCNLYFCSLQ